MRRRRNGLGKAAATGAAIAAGPRGLRRLLGIAIVIGLFIVLAVAALVTAMGKAGSAGSGPLPCTPGKVNVRYSTSDTPQWAKEAVEKALKDTKRESHTVTEAGDSRDLIVVYWPTSEGAEPKLSGKTLRLDESPRG